MNVLPVAVTQMSLHTHILAVPLEHSHTSVTAGTLCYYNLSLSKAFPAFPPHHCVLHSFLCACVILKTILLSVVCRGRVQDVSMHLRHGAV